eukprot:gene8108-8977_t
MKFHAPTLIIIIVGGIILTFQIEIALAAKASSCQMTTPVCDRTLSMRNLSRDIIIGALFPLNYYQSKTRTFVQNSVAITWVEAFLFAINTVNNDHNMFKNVTLGYDIRNSCNEKDTALRNVLDFMLDRSLFDGRVATTTPPRQNCYCASGRSRITAVVGGAWSSISTAVSPVLGVDSLPQISYSSTSTALSDKGKFPNFLRTLPSDNYQAKALADLLRHFDWTYISVLASDDDYGRLGWFGLDRELKHRGMCVAEVKLFKRKLSTVLLNEIIVLLTRAQKKKANVVVLWCQINEAMLIIEEAWKRGLRGITWIGCETLGANFHMLGLGPIVKGFLGLKPILHTVPKFEAYLHQLSPSTQQHRSPWLEQYWKSLDNATRGCGGIKTGKDLPRNKYSYVISAVYAVALGLQRILDKNPSLTVADLSSMKSSLLLQEMKNIDYVDADGGIRVSFDKNGDPKFGSYTVTNIQAANGSVYFVDIGNWTGETGRVRVNKNKIVYSDNQRIVTSICSKPCAPGTYKISGSTVCCWSCIPCGKGTVNTNGSALACHACPENSISNSNRTSCIELTELFVFRGRRNHGIFIAILTISCIAIVCTLLFVCVFVRHWNTPVVKSSNRELSMLQLISVMLSLSYPFIFWLEITPSYCHLISVWFSLFTTVAVAIVLVKTYRLLMIFTKETTGESSFLQNKYQCVFVLIFVLVEVIIMALWLWRHKMVVVETVFEEDRTFVRHCEKHLLLLVAIDQAYIFAMSLASAFMAFKARKLPEAFREARFISFAMFVFCLAWVCAIPLVASLDIIERRQALCAVNCIANFGLLLCLYGYKVHIILFQPERNTRTFFTTQATLRMFSQRTRARSFQRSFVLSNDSTPASSPTTSRVSYPPSQGIKSIDDIRNEIPAMKPKRQRSMTQ